MSKQILFEDLELNNSHAGILLDSGDVLCSCCGGIFEKSEENIKWRKIKEYDNWVNFEDCIKE